MERDELIRKKKEREAVVFRRFVSNLCSYMCWFQLLACLSWRRLAPREQELCCVSILCIQPEHSVNICEVNEAGVGREQMFVENLLSTHMLFTYFIPKTTF